MDIITALLNDNYSEFKKILTEKLDLLIERKKVQLKRVMGAQLSEDVQEILDEANVIKQGRVLLIRRRIRRGKLQRNVRKSAVKGFTLKRGKLKRIPASKRIHMRIVQRRAARKRKQHLQMSLRKRKISLRKRKAMGIR